MLGLVQAADSSSTESRPKFWLWPNLLSLDAPFVAVLWQILFVRCFHVAVDALPRSILLVTSVWLIYAADRALDAWRGERSSSPRHRFYHAHWRILLPLWMAVLAASAWLALTELPAVLLRRGCVLMGVVVVYFTIVHSGIFVHGHMGPVRAPGRVWLVSKEASVGLVFALGADQLCAAVEQRPHGGGRGRHRAVFRPLLDQLRGHSEMGIRPEMDLGSEVGNAPLPPLLRGGFATVRIAR